MPLKISSVLLFGFTFLMMVSLCQAADGCLKLEKVLTGNSFVASGQMIQIWGIKAPDAETPYGYAAKLYLAAMLADTSLQCKIVDETIARQCRASGVDIGQRLVQMGMAKATAADYADDEEHARSQKYGIWKAKAAP